MLNPGIMYGSGKKKVVWANGVKHGAHFHLWREGTPEEGKGRRSLMHLQGQKSYSSQKSYKCSWSPYSVQDLVLGVSSTKTEALSAVPSAWVLAWV